MKKKFSGENPLTVRGNLALNQMSSAAGSANEKTSDAIDVSKYARYTTLKITSPAPMVLQVELNRPQKRNAMNRAYGNLYLSVPLRVLTAMTA